MARNSNGGSEQKAKKRVGDNEKTDAAKKRRTRSATAASSSEVSCTALVPVAGPTLMLRANEAHADGWKYSTKGKIERRIVKKFNNVMNCADIITILQMPVKADVQPERLDNAIERLDRLCVDLTQPEEVEHKDPKLEKILQRYHRPGTESEKQNARKAATAYLARKGMTVDEDIFNKDAARKYSPPDAIEDDMAEVACRLHQVRLFPRSTKQAQLPQWVGLLGFSISELLGVFHWACQSNHETRKGSDGIVFHGPLRVAWTAALMFSWLFKSGRDEMAEALGDKPSATDVKSFMTGFVRSAINRQTLKCVDSILNESDEMAQRELVREHFKAICEILNLAGTDIQALTNVAHRETPVETWRAPVESICSETVQQKFETPSGDFSSAAPRNYARVVEEQARQSRSQGAPPPAPRPSNVARAPVDAPRPGPQTPPQPPRTSFQSPPSECFHTPQQSSEEDFVEPFETRPENRQSCEPQPEVEISEIVITRILEILRHRREMAERSRESAHDVLRLHKGRSKKVYDSGDVFAKGAQAGESYYARTKSLAASVKNPSHE